jgi:recombinational DNA repair protein (RecF pathway)
MDCELCHQPIQEHQGYYLVSEKGCCKQCYDLNIKQTFKSNHRFLVSGLLPAGAAEGAKRKPAWTRPSMG